MCICTGFFFSALSISVSDIQSSTYFPLNLWGAPLKSAWFLIPGRALDRLVYRIHCETVAPQCNIPINPVSMQKWKEGHIFQFAECNRSCKALQTSVCSIQYAWTRSFSQSLCSLMTAVQVQSKFLATLQFNPNTASFECIPCLWMWRWLSLWEIEPHCAKVTRLNASCTTLPLKVKDKWRYSNTFPPQNAPGKQLKQTTPQTNDCERLLLVFQVLNNQGHLSMFCPY